MVTRFTSDGCDTLGIRYQPRARGDNPSAGRRAAVRTRLARAPIPPRPPPHDPRDPIPKGPQHATTTEIDVTGTMTLTPVGLEPVDLGQRSASARLIADIDRTSLGNSLKFSLPVDLLTGEIQLDVEVQPGRPHSMKCRYQEREREMRGAW